MTDVAPATEPVRATPSLVLVSAASNTQRETVACTDLLTRGPIHESDVLFVDLTTTPARRLHQWRTHAEETPPNVTVLTPMTHPQQPNPLGDSTQNLSIEQIDSPGNVTNLGVSISRCLDDVADTANQTRLCFHSLTSFLHYVDVRTAFKFFTVLKGQLASVNATAHVHVDPNAHDDDKVIARLSPLFDECIDATELDGR